MSRRVSSPLRPSACLRGMAWGVALLVLVPFATAASPARRLPLYSRVAHSLFPTDDPGYLPMAGAPALRVGPPPTVIPVSPAPIVLYAPPEPAAKSASAPIFPSAPAAVVADTTPPPATADRKPPPLRPEDFLPYFQLNDGTGRGGPAEGFQFMPARPELPSSQASFHQQ